mmetsp:Transcript_37704/g.76253  ORF Transcript_37704/g.76253 Transcript_37704/m.76253 type:complete len:110 (+) Transcript_37704:2041-2370(+)
MLHNSGGGSGAQELQHSFYPSSLSISSSLSVPSMNFNSFVQRALTTGKCLHVLTDDDGTKATISMPPDELESLSCTAGKPIIVVLFTFGDCIRILCQCPPSRVQRGGGY